MNPYDVSESPVLPQVSASVAAEARLSPLKYALINLTAMLV